jgi:hypothetical protein
MAVIESATEAEAPEALVCAASREDPLELQSPSRMELDLVDCEEGEEDRTDDHDTKLPTTSDVPSQDPAVPDQVQPSVPYDID